jgi:hypothetical protein
MEINNIETREKLAEYFAELGFKVGAEIGVEQGKFTEVLCKAGLEVYAIDAWQAYKGYRDHVNQKKLDGFLEKVKERVALYHCNVMKAFSMDALKDFNDESLDFVYIDANHSFRHAADDIHEWSKKIRKGGIVSGHDYAVAVNKQGLNACHVKYVVDAWVEAKEIELFTTKERTPSWFYIKK